MITIKVSRNDAGKIIGLSASGHSGYAEEGSDIICSAVSAIVQTAALGVDRVAGVKPRVLLMERGQVRLEVDNPADRETARVVQAILATVVVGLEELAAAYGKYVTIQD